MAEWNKSKVLPGAINGGQEFITKDNLAINELNAIVNNSFYASEISETSIAKADSAVATSKLAEDKIDNFIKTEGNSVVTLNGVPQVTWSADFAEAERQKSKNLFNVNNGFLPGGLNNGSVANTDMLSFSISNGVLSLIVTASWRGIHSDYFSLKENTIYTFAKQSGDSAYCIIEMYDASKTYLGNIDVQFNDILTFTTVSGTAYARISFNNTVVGTVEISEIYLAEESSFSGYTKYSGAVCHKGDAEIQFAETEMQKSRNLIAINTYTETKNGLVITSDNNTNIISLKGTSTEKTEHSFWFAYVGDTLVNFKDLVLKAGRTYTFAVIGRNDDHPYYLCTAGCIKISDGSYISDYFYVYNTNKKMTFTPTEDMKIDHLSLYINNYPSGHTADYEGKIILVEGVHTVDELKDVLPYNGVIVHKKDIADVEHIETVYDMSSSDTNKNWGYTGGISAGTEITGKDFSKYKYLKFYCNTMTFDVSCVNGQRRGGSATIFDNNYIYFFTIKINEELTGFSSVFGLKDNSNQFIVQTGTEIIQRIEGVY